MRWERCPVSKVSTAYSGSREIGAVGRVPCSATRRFYWRISDVAESRHGPATTGECSTESGARASFRRAWRIWLTERGLVEQPA